MTRNLIALFGAAVALAGGDKLVGNRGYKAMFRHLGWSREAMRGVAAAEMVGGSLLMLPWTRRLGAVVVAATSATVLASEMRHGDPQLAAPRGLVLLASLAALLAPNR